MRLKRGGASIRRIDRGDLCPIATLHPFVVDEEARWLDILPSIGGRKLN